MLEDDHKEYHRFLSKRSRLAYLYRRFYLYPILSRFLNGRVLDVGPGIGDFLEYYKQATGVDVNPNNIDYCNKRGLEAHLIKNGQLPFGSKTFEGAIIDNVLEHLADPLPTLREIHRVLIPGGTLIVGVPGVKGYDSAPDHKKFYSEKSLMEVVHESNFHKIKILHMPIRSAWLDKNMRQYCVYGIFEAINL